MTKEEADQIAELFKCDECAPTFRISDDKEKGYFIPCEKHKDITNLNYFKKMNIHKELKMTERQRIQNNERAKTWYQAHKDDPKWKSRRKKYDKKHYQKNKKRIKAQQKSYRENLKLTQLKEKS